MTGTFDDPRSPQLAGKRELGKKGGASPSSGVECSEGRCVCIVALVFRGLATFVSALPRSQEYTMRASRSVNISSCPYHEKYCLMSPQGGRMQMHDGPVGMCGAGVSIISVPH